ncbi:MAG TPA: class I SAM-dependent methyltransferase [Clostridia bacterium]|nr:class I SAM-dependent methyltransferase [Clostridia bacterium]
MGIEIDKEIIKSNEDIFTMLDTLLERRGGEWWDKFYSDRSKPIPFFINAPDENLVSFLEKGLFKRGRAFDIGCGNGRNSIFLAKQGFEVDGIDFSTTSIEWANQNASEEHVDVNFINKSIFDFQVHHSSYDFVYDSGCLHHIKPHRRNQYIKKIIDILKPGAYFGLTAFNLKGGANISDYDVYRDFSMHGGIGFSELKLKSILSPHFEIVEFREMKEISDNSLFGKAFCWAVLMKKR